MQYVLTTKEEIMYSRKNKEHQLNNPIHEAKIQKLNIMYPSNYNTA